MSGAAMPPYKKLKISYLLPDFDEDAYSGGLYVIFQHCNGLIEKGHDVKAFNNTGKKSRYLRLDCPVEIHKNDPSIVEANSPDIIVGTYWHTYFFINRMQDIVKNGTKLCFLVQNDDRFIYAEEDKPLICKVMTTKYKNALPIHKIVVSQYLKDIVRDDFREESFYVRNGFEIRETEPLLPKSEKVRIVARYDPSTFRGWDLADKVLNKVARERSDIEIHLFEMKDKKPTKYKSVFHKGLSGDNLLGLFKSCDIYLCGSRYEGFAYPIIEAMSQGACVCCADAGGNREFCIDGETALVSGRDDDEGLYRNLLRLLDDKGLRARIRANGIKKAGGFSWQESLDRLEKFFIELSAQDYKGATAAISTCPPRRYAKERILLIYGKDPFNKYKDWVNVEESVDYLNYRGFSVSPLLFIDRRSLKSMKARLGLLAGPQAASAFKYKIFYSKKLKLRLPLLPRPLFAASIIGNLIAGIFSKEKRYTGVIFTAGKNRALKSLCRILGVRFYDLDFNSAVLAPYSPDPCAKENSEKERKYRELIDKMLNAVAEA